MAKKTKVEEGAEQAKQIAEGIEAAVAAWSPVVALAAKGVRLLIASARRRGEVSPEDAEAFERDAAACDGLIDQMEARAAEYRRRRAAETGEIPPATGD